MRIMATCTLLAIHNRLWGDERTDAQRSHGRSLGVHLVDVRQSSGECVGCDLVAEFVPVVGGF